MQSCLANLLPSHYEGGVEEVKNIGLLGTVTEARSSVPSLKRPAGCVLIFTDGLPMRLMMSIFD